MKSHEITVASTPPPPTQAETDFHRLFDLSLDLLCIAGLDGFFKQVNPSWTRVLGWSHEELLSRPVSDFIHPDDRERTLQARAGLSRGVPVRELENRYLCKDGSYRWLSWQSSIEPGAQKIFAVARDITERRQADHERIVSGKLESTGILAGGIAHDFNNLLASLLLNLEVVSMVGPITDQQKQLLENARKSVHSAKSLTQQLIIFAEGGTPHRKTTDLKEILTHSLALALSGSNIRGASTFSSDLWPAEVDEIQIGQVIQNLALNAREAMPTGGTVWLKAENVMLNTLPDLETPTGRYVHISITDEGGGIPTETLTKVFDPYFSTKQRGLQKGMGLGLTICHAIIHKHGGMMTVDSQPGRGTTVHCHLPASNNPVSSPSVPPTVEPVLSKKILVMDDEENLREIMAETLTQIGYSVELAKDGDEAVTLYEQARNDGSPFAAVLLDLAVKGGMGGNETMQLLRERDPAIRAILMTGYNHEATYRDPARYGFNGAIAKPFSVDSLRDALETVLGTNDPS